MKCPKCDYLGFDTGDRCKNCGYDFSLIATPGSDHLRLDSPPTEHTPTTKYWLDQLDAALSNPDLGPARRPESMLESPPPVIDPVISPPPVMFAPPAVALPEAVRAPAPIRTPDARLPLFRPPDEDDDDRPLVKLPASPRPPLAVRKTPESPRLRAVPKPLPRIEEPVLNFPDDYAPNPALRLRDEEPEPSRPARAAAAVTHAGLSSAGERLGAAAIDHAILLAIDATVVYFTLRMANLPLDSWRMLPAAPLLAFLLLVTFAYFFAFTAVGGQTIGKMALGIRVVSVDPEGLDGARALRRTCAGLASLLLGLGFVPALFDAEHRAFHDRIAHTRVVSLHSA